MPSDRSRSWCWTLNAADGENDFPVVTYNEKEFVYMTYGRETGEQGRRHLQGFVYVKNKKSLRQMKTAFDNNRIHLEVMRGTHDEAIKYCHKDGDFKEFGERPKQGCRHDIESLAEEIKAGNTTMSNIVLDHPHLAFQYGRYFDRLEDELNLQKKRTSMTEGFWFWGCAGSGKTREVYSLHADDDIYVYNPQDKGWWDGYKGQKVVLIDDFRGELQYSFLLRLCDRYPCTVPRRNRMPHPFLAEKIYITAPLPPEDVFKNLSERDSLDQLHRRFSMKHFVKLQSGES